MLTGFGGPPRSGKSYTAMSDFYLATIKAGLNGKPRPIFTNIRGILNDDCLFATAEYTGASVSQIMEQVTLVNEMWMLDIANKCPNGALVIADEAHIFWCSREWKNFTEESRNWFSEHGRFHVDIVWISQTPESIEKWITGRTEFVHIALNLKFFGFPNKCVLKTRTGTTKKGLSKKFITYKPEIYNCYTSYEGDNPYDLPVIDDKAFNKKWLFVGLALALVFVVFVSGSKEDSPQGQTLNVEPGSHQTTFKRDTPPPNVPALKPLKKTPAGNGYILSLLKSKIVYEGYAQIANKFYGYVSFFNGSGVTRLSFIELKILGIDYQIPYSNSSYILLTYNDSTYYGRSQAPIVQQASSLTAREPRASVELL